MKVKFDYGIMRMYDENGVMVMKVYPFDDIRILYRADIIDLDNEELEWNGVYRFYSNNNVKLIPVYGEDLTTCLPLI